MTHAVPETDGRNDGSRHRILLGLAAGFATPLVALAWAGSVAWVGAGPEADAAALFRAVAPMAAAALLIATAAWLTVAAVLRVVADRATAEASPLIRQNLCIDSDHDLRNLLQVVASLLSLELRRAGSAGERASLLRMQWRLQSLALVQRRRSALDAATGVRLDLLAAEIADGLIAARPPGPRPVEMRVALDQVWGSPDRATAFGLFVNEALVNALRHLDEAGCGGTVSVALRAFGDGAWLLTILNGVGQGCETSAASGGIGQRLMTNCAEQLGATLSMERRDETYEVRLASSAQPARR